MARVIKTKITEMLGIQYPILLGAMQGLTTAELVAAVSNAGGLGVMATSSFKNKEELREEIKKCQALTDKPFAVNLTLLPSLGNFDYPGFIEVCIEEGVKVLETSGRAPAPYMAQIKAGGLKVIHKCTTVKHAKKAESIGCDAVIIDGCEAGGHIGENDISSSVLWPAAVDALSIPVIACGGVADGRGLAAAFIYGCEGATVGTRFFLSDEAPACAEVKKDVAETATEMDTILVTRRYTNTARMLKRGLAVKIREMEDGGASFAEVCQYQNQAHMKHLFDTGDFENGILTIGESVGLIHDVLPVKTIIDNMVSQCLECMGRFDG